MFSVVHKAGFAEDDLAILYLVHFPGESTIMGESAQGM